MENKKLFTHDLQRPKPIEYHQNMNSKLIVVLDNVRSAQNIGSVFRTCDAFLIGEIHLCGICATPPNRELLKTSLGAENTVPWIYFNSIEDSIQSLKSNGFEIYAIEQTKHSIALNAFTIPEKPFAIILGNEVEGVSDIAIQSANACIEIPQGGSKHSLNVSVAAGVILWELQGKTITLNRDSF